MLIKQDFYFPAADANRPLHIYLPDDYQKTGERYPVMYFFDGHNLFRDQDATYGTSWGLEQFMQAWPKKMIIVGLECSHVGNERLSEYSPHSFYSPHFGDIEGNGRATLDWLVHDVKNFMDENFPTLRHREATGIAGSSMGGLMALTAVCCYNSVFSKAACLSSAVDFEPVLVWQDLKSSFIDSNTRVYMSLGEGENGHDRAPLHQGLLDYLARFGAATNFYLQEGGHHNEDFWAEQNWSYMDFLWRS
ncbi:alpha/beta hydrolase [Streptococcus caprae]|uniref:Alpha/beta hydrolase n=1 Tax=Streptococcus caprae TaxID=1640501 RepID=A0ABV8CY76_9STRE